MVNKHYVAIHYTVERLISRVDVIYYKCTDSEYAIKILKMEFDLKILHFY